MHVYILVNRGGYPSKKMRNKQYINKKRKKVILCLMRRDS